MSGIIIKGTPTNLEPGDERGRLVVDLGGHVLTHVLLGNLQRTWLYWAIRFFPPKKSAGFLFWQITPIEPVHKSKAIIYYNMYIYIFTLHIPTYLNHKERTRYTTDLLRPLKDDLLFQDVLVEELLENHRHPAPGSYVMHTHFILLSSLIQEFKSPQ